MQAAQGLSTTCGGGEDEEVGDWEGGDEEEPVRVFESPLSIFLSFFCFLFSVWNAQRDEGEGGVCLKGREHGNGVL